MLDTLAHEIEVQSPTVPVACLGVNAVGYESGNATVTAGRSIPWLQDLPDQGAWARWGVAFCDVVILDRENRAHAVYNLTTHDLSDPANRAELKALLLEAAAAVPGP